MIGSRGLAARVRRHRAARRRDRFATRGARPRGHGVRAKTFQRGGEHRGMRIRVLPSIPTKNLETASNTLAATLRVLFEPFDVVHYHGVGPSLFSWIPAARGMTTVATIHAGDYRQSKWGPGGARAASPRREDRGPSRRTRRSPFRGSWPRELEERYGRAVAYIPNGAASARSASLRRGAGSRTREREIHPHRRKVHRRARFPYADRGVQGCADRLPARHRGGRPFRGELRAASQSGWPMRASYFPDTFPGRSSTSSMPIALSTSSVDGRRASDIASRGDELLASGARERHPGEPRRSPTASRRPSRAETRRISRARSRECSRMDEAERRRVGEARGIGSRAEYTWDHVTDEVEALYRRLVTAARSERAADRPPNRESATERQFLLTPSGLFLLVRAESGTPRALRREDVVMKRRTASKCESRARPAGSSSLCLLLAGCAPREMAGGSAEAAGSARWRGAGRRASGRREIPRPRRARRTTSRMRCPRRARRGRRSSSKSSSRSDPIRSACRMSPMEESPKQRYDIGYRDSGIRVGRSRRGREGQGARSLRKPGMSAYIEYEEGLYKVRAGDFAERKDAAQARSKLAGAYPGSWIVRTTIRR